MEFFAKQLEKKSYLWLNESVRRLFLQVIPSWLQTKLAKNFSDVVNVELRHSSTQVGDYNLLLSDVDVSVVVGDSTTNARIREINHAYENLRGRWLFLGEAEIFRASEYAEKRALEERYGELVTTLRTLRKIDWIKPDERPYHRLKFERSQKKMKHRLERLRDATYLESLKAQWTNGQTFSMARDPDVIRHAEKYLGSGHGLLSGDFKAWLCEILPIETMQTLQPSAGNSLRLALLRLEIIQVQAGERLLENEAIRVEYRAWLKILDNELVKTASALEATRR